LHYTTLHNTTLHNTTRHETTRHYATPLHCTNCITLHYTTPHHTTLNYTTLHYPTLPHIAVHYITLHSLHHHKCNCNYTTLITLHHNYNSTTTTTTTTAALHHYIQQLWVRWTRWPLQPLQPLQKTQLQPPLGPSVDSLCHPWFTATNLSYSFPIFETSATALCGTTGIFAPSTLSNYTIRKAVPSKCLCVCVCGVGAWFVVRSFLWHTCAIGLNTHERRCTCFGCLASSLRIPWNHVGASRWNLFSLGIVSFLEQLLISEL